MGLAEDIARVRQRARGAEINARHRRGREKARQMAAAMAPSTPADGVNPQFAQSLEAARKRAKVALEQREKPKAPSDRIQQLVMEGKLPPRAGDGGVGYEPTAEEVLGELGEPTAPDGTEDLPDADAVLAGDEPYPPENAGDWGQPPAAAAAPPGAAVSPSVAPPLARPGQPVQHKRKRGR